MAQISTFGVVTLRGSATSKSSSTILTASSASVAKSDSLLVAVSYIGSEPPSIVEYGDIELALVKESIDLTNGFGVGLYFHRYMWSDDSRDVVATWDSAIEAKAMVVVTVSGPYMENEALEGLSANTSGPTIGPTGILKEVDEVAFGILSSNGPVEDTVPTLSPVEWSFVARVGTTGGGPATNVTLLFATATDEDANPRSLTGSGATSRDWANILTTFDDIEFTARDFFGAPMKVNDNVKHAGLNDNVAEVHPSKNVVRLTNAGWVAAVDCRVKS